MSEMVERVAAAIHAVDGFTPWERLPDENTSYGIGKIQRRAEATAAIEAMREPTPEMIGAGEDAVWANLDCDRIWGGFSAQGLAVAVFRAMHAKG